MFLFQCNIKYLCMFDRGCNYGYRTGCKEQDFLGRVAILCFCDEDLCNLSADHSPTSYNIVIALFLILLSIL